MRQVFSSPRTENVEGVAQMLRDAGIQVRVTHGRSYRGGLRGNFTYRDNAREGPVPAVWVVLSEDQPRAREMLRAQGLLDSTRGDTGYRLPVFRSEELLAAGDPGRKRAFRLKMGLLLVIAVVIGLAFFSRFGPTVATTAPRTTAASLPAGASPTPDALAIAVLAGELPTRAGQALCLSVDGGDPSPALLAALPPTPGRVIALSQCPASDLPRLAISDYRVRAPSGAGSISLSRAVDAGAAPVVETYEVSHNERGWRVIELL
jgi:hypothetical protein